MIISHERRFVFVKTKKTAGTSVELFLATFSGEDAVVTPVSPEDETVEHRPRNYRGPFNPLPEAIEFLGVRSAEWSRVTGGGLVQPFGQAMKGKRYYNHIPAFRAAARLGAELWNSYFTFTIERNPWDKALSQYYWKARHRPGYTFGQFIAEGDVGINYPRYCHPASGAVMVDRIIYYHDLSRALAEVCGRLEIPWPGSLPARAKGGTRTDRKPYQELFTGELTSWREAIERLFAFEIQLHGWDFDSGLPARDNPGLER